MLSEEGRPRRRYYSRFQAVVVAVAGSLFFLVFLSGLFASEYFGVKVLVAISMLGMGVTGIRLFRSGIETFDKGIRVRNVFSTLELSWQEIESFEIGRYHLLPRVCLIRLQDGSTKHGVGITERNVYPDGSAEAMADELNAELAQRTGGGSAQPQVAVDSR